MNASTFQEQDVKVSVERITPKDAIDMLESSNIKNRKLSKNRVDRYVRDMKSGNWRFNGDAIRFDNNGHLIDGQHRLNAAARSGASFDFLVVRGVNPDAKKTIDTGKARSGGDALSIEVDVSDSDSHVIGGAIQLFDRYKKVNGFGGYGGGASLTNSEVVERFYQYESLIRSSLEWVNSTVNRRGLIIPKSYILFIHMVLSENSKPDADEFLRKILTGVDLSNNSTELFLREILIETKMKTRRLNRVAIVNSIFKCWNALRRGAGIKHKGNCVWSNIRDKKVIAK